VGLLSGTFSALAYVQLVALSRSGEPETRTVYYFAIGSAVGGAAWTAATGFSQWNWLAAAWLLPMGLLASIGQWCMTRAYSDTGGGGTLLVANLQYAGILFSALLGYLFFGDHITVSGWWGIALIIGSGVAATAMRTRSIPSAPADDH
jgi:drug/metabolite transporter (DMT)-like permease